MFDFRKMELIGFEKASCDCYDSNSVDCDTPPDVCDV